MFIHVEASLNQKLSPNGRTLEEKSGIKLTQPPCAKHKEPPPQHVGQLISEYVDHKKGTVLLKLTLETSQISPSCLDL